MHNMCIKIHQCLPTCNNVGFRVADLWRPISLARAWNCLSAQQSGIDKKIRQHLVKNRMLGGVVSMPSNIFATTGTNVSVPFIDATNREEVILIDASNLGEKIKEGKNQKTVLRPEDEQRIIETFNAKKAVEDFSVPVSYEKIETKNYSLSAGQYFEVKIDYVEISDEEFGEVLKGHQRRLTQLSNESHAIEATISDQLQRLKYG